MSPRFIPFSIAWKSEASSPAYGWRKPASAGGDTTNSPRRARRFSRSSAIPGPSLSTRSIALREGNMPDWSKEIRAAIAGLNMDPAREASLVEELSQHLADRYNELRGNGVDNAEACALLKGEFNDGTLVAELKPLLSPSLEVPAPGIDKREPKLAGVGNDLRQSLRLL